LQNHPALAPKVAAARLDIAPVNRVECYALTTLDQASELCRRVGPSNFSYMYDVFDANIEARDPIAAFRAQELHRHPYLGERLICDFQGDRRVGL
jgi:sugar phosphate isomerase/epimerase